MNKHPFDINPFDIIDEQLHNHYYDKLLKKGLIF